jgi:hypothetical protein
MKKERRHFAGKMDFPEALFLPKQKNKEALDLI